MEFSHIPVLFNEVIEGLDIKPDGIYLDGTVGGGGHSSAIAARLTTGHLYCTDRDEEALAAAGARLSEYGDKVSLMHSNYADAAGLLRGMGVESVDGILLDLGVSSYQLDNPERGFSYREDAPLDMRMDRSGGISASDIVNEWSEEELKRVIRDYGEDKCAGRIARAIVGRRNTKRIETTFELNEIIASAMPARMRADTHPSKRTYQALRIACNGELEALERALDEMAELLGPGGRLAIISFHSLEDRIVKQKFKEWEDPCICPKNFPKCVCGRVPKGRRVNHKAITATEEELRENRRSKPAKLRIFEKEGRN
ncbi:MAG: 16S rRNA (cytosine(1402)-N(4))-methyltransferase RsmH [Lachnospiraceae bacterium]|nr:16S rRNA (cytosine(1402)-N(4))-methyltransferase RsmH [Lachnospiraceae bacterium]